MANQPVLNLTDRSVNYQSINYLLIGNLICDKVNIELTDSLSKSLGSKSRPSSSCSFKTTVASCQALNAKEDDMIICIIYTLDSVYPCCDFEQLTETIRELEAEGEAYEFHCTK